ncbi:type IV pilus assembly protein PilX [Gammaproteobacteria bacterium]
MLTSPRVYNRLFFIIHGGLYSQQGMVLVVALIFLLVMSLIGVAAMQGSNQEERMGDNTRQRILAFQAAEAALRAGETYLLNTSPLVYNGTWLRDIADRLTTADFGNCDITTFWSKSYCWDGTTAMNCATDPPGSTTGTCTSASQQVDLSDTNLHEQPRYIIERLAQLQGNTGGSLRGGQAINPNAVAPSLYQVTAHGIGGTSDAVIVLQSLYIR